MSDAQQFGAEVTGRGFQTHLAAASARAAAVDTVSLVADALLPTPTEHYLSGTYPPLKAMGPASEVEVLSGTTDRLNVYLHIPFCRQRCTFCHFAKEIKATPERVAQYLEALTSEIAMIADRLGERQITSVYVGGGTPSILSPHELSYVLDTLHERFPWHSDAEITFELHPQVVRDRTRLAEQLRACKRSGVNRIAFGIQSLDDRVLRTLNRGHTAAEALELIDVLHGEFDNVSIDLMYGLPYETPETWSRTLDTIVGQGVDKLNIFPLFLKVTDPITRLYERKPEVFPDQYERLVTHLLTDEYLRDHGFRQGPVLYYSRAEHHSRQQESKFDGIEDANLLGLGVSAFGYIGGSQYYNHCDMDSYMSAVTAGRLPLWRATTLSTDELARRTIMFSLRSAGVSRSAFATRFGQVPEQWFPQLASFAERGLLACVDDWWTVTDIGAYCVDSMAAQLASDAVRQRVTETNSAIGNPRKNLLEQHDYSPLGRTGSHVARSANSVERR